MRLASEINEKLIKLISSRYTHRNCYTYIAYSIVTERDCKREALIWNELWDNTAEIVMSHLSQLKVVTIKTVKMQQLDVSSRALSCFHCWLVQLFVFYYWNFSVWGESGQRTHKLDVHFLGTIIIIIIIHAFKWKMNINFMNKKVQVNLIFLQQLEAGKW